MSDVAVRVLYSLEPALHASGSSLDDLLVEHDLSPTRIRYFPASRIPWNTFAELLEDAGERLGGLSALEEIGSGFLLGDWDGLRALLTRYVTPTFAYELGVRWIGPAIFRGTSGHLTEVPGGIVQTVFIPPNRRDSPEFFWLCGGVIRDFPRLMGWETTEFEIAHFDHRAEYRLRYVRSVADEPGRPVGWSEVRLNRDLEEISILYVGQEDASGPEKSVGVGDIPVSDRVREALCESAGESSWNASEVAKKLGLSERSLVRRLSDEGTSFRVIRDRVRREMAIDRIRRGLPIATVCESLGFADVPSFHRAFLRWTGEPPGRFRRDPKPRE